MGFWVIRLLLAVSEPVLVFTFALAGALRGARCPVCSSSFPGVRRNGRLRLRTPIETVTPQKGGRASSRAQAFQERREIRAREDAVERVPTRFMGPKRVG